METKLVSESFIHLHSLWEEYHIQNAHSLKVNTPFNSTKILDDPTALYYTSHKNTNQEVLLAFKNKSKTHKEMLYDQHQISPLNS